MERYKRSAKMIRGSTVAGRNRDSFAFIGARKWRIH